ncbi:hypothetical protein RJ55_01831 [Drechmeria coniospora]|nr:hypothetical protein RJ55_01831 [Drechmeria coniospora]
MRAFAFGAVLAISHATSILKPDIRADTNRDGRVDIKGSTDVHGKDTWTNSAGALFLANIGDTNRRCSDRKDMQGGPETVSDEKLMGCHDAADDIQRSPQYLAPMRTVPLSNLSPRAFGSISISEEQSRKLVRIFRRSGDGWQIVHNDTILTVEELAKGLELGIDARDGRKPTWDGKATVRFSVTDGNQTSTDKVALRVAPLLAHHHLQKVEKVIAPNVSEPDPWSTMTRATFDDIDKIMQREGFQVPIQHINTMPLEVAQDPRTTILPTEWVQDQFEATYMSIPGPSGPVVMRIMVSTSNLWRDDHRVAFQTLRDTGIGAMYYPTDKFVPDLDHFGNLETIPPYELNGKRYPTGRIILGGEEEGLKPVATDLFRAQEVQDPLLIDSMWLPVGHVDEFLQFLPANTSRGWSIMVNDPHAGTRLLWEAYEAGLGPSLFYSRPSGASSTVETIVAAAEWAAAEMGNATANTMAADRIQATIDLLKKETGITDEEIFRVPAPYYWSTYKCTRTPQEKRLSRRSTVRRAEVAVSPDYCFSRRAGKGVVRTIVPPAVNGIVLSRSRYIAPKPWGPVVNGTDIFEKAARDCYKKAGFEVDFVDDWSLFVDKGDIHCATNVLRDASAAWWKL